MIRLIELIELWDEMRILRLILVVFVTKLEQNWDFT